MNTKVFQILAASLTLLAANGAYAACALTDATYSPNHPDGPHQNADACMIFNGSEGGGNIELSQINGFWGGSFGGGAFQTASKDDGATTSPTVSLFGGDFNFIIDSSTLSSTFGTYTVTATDANGAGTDPDFPFFLDFVIGLKGGSSEASAYLFDDVVSDGSGGGAWTVTFQNSGGQTPNLSNLTLFVREGTGQANGGGPGNGNGNGNNVPEPGTLALMGGALFGLWAVRRRKET